MSNEVTGHGVATTVLNRLESRVLVLPVWSLLSSFSTDAPTEIEMCMRLMVILSFLILGISEFAVLHADDSGRATNFQDVRSRSGEIAFQLPQRSRAYFIAMNEVNVASQDFSVLGLREVMQELRIEAVKARVITPKIQKKMAEALEVSKRLGELDSLGEPELLHGLAADFKTAAEKSLRTMLSKEQIQRLKQLTLQRNGISAFSLPIVVQKLRITSEQQVKLRTLQRAGGRALRSAIRGAKEGDLRRKLLDDMERVRKEYVAKALKVLTKPQQNAYAKLIGKPFDFASSHPKK